VRSFAYNPISLVPSFILRLLSPIVAFVQQNLHILLTTAAIGGVLLAAPVVGLAVIRLSPIVVFVLLLFPLAVVMIHKTLPRFELGPVIILFAALFLPFHLSTGTESRLVDSFLLTLLFFGNWVVHIMVDKQHKFVATPVNKPIIAFVVVVFVSIIWGNLFMDPLVDPKNLSSKFFFVQMATALTIVMLPGALLLTVNHINHPRYLKLMVGFMLVAGVLAASHRLGWQRFYAPNDEGLFSMWIIGLSLGLALFVKNINRLHQIALISLAGVWFYLRFFEGITWLAGWLPSVIIITILLFSRSKKLFFVVLLIFAVYIAANFDYYAGDVLEAETSESGNTRMAAWEANWRVTSQHLLLGTGPAGYAAYYMSYWPNEAMATHNSMLDILAQFGVVGWALIMWIFGTLIWKGYRLRQRLVGRGDFMEALANITFAGTISTLVIAFFGDWLVPFTYTQTIAGFDYIVISWLFIGTMIVIDRLTQPTTDTSLLQTSAGQ
jgi:hypothetical protein